MTMASAQKATCVQLIILPLSNTESIRRKVAVAEVEIPAPAAVIENLDGILDLLGSSVASRHDGARISADRCLIACRNVTDTTAHTLGLLGESSGKIQVLKLVRSLTMTQPQYIDSMCPSSSTHQSGIKTLTELLLYSPPGGVWCPWH